MSAFGFPVKNKPFKEDKEKKNSAQVDSELQGWQLLFVGSEVLIKVSDVLRVPRERLGMLGKGKELLIFEHVGAVVMSW